MISLMPSRRSSWTVSSRRSGLLVAVAELENAPQLEREAGKDLGGVGFFLADQAFSPLPAAPGVDRHLAAEAVDDPVLLDTQVAVFGLLFVIIAPLVRGPS